MKLRFTLFLLVLTQPLFAQMHQSSNFKGTWVKCKATFNDATDLPDDAPLKYTYFKYQFADDDKLWISTTYRERGTEMRFKLNYNFLIIETPEGGVINNFSVSKRTDTLVLLQLGRDGLPDFNSIKLYFVPEKKYQKAIELKTSDIYSIRNHDTTYKESAKIYADFKGDSFQRFIYHNMSGYNTSGKSGHLAAGFIVSAKGIADSLKIYEGISDKFDKHFTKIFNKIKNEWTPALLDDKTVPVYMTLDLRYFTSSETLPAYSLSQKANEAYNNKDYKLALYYFEEALKDVPTDNDNLFKRGMCKLYLGNTGGACEDWKMVKESGYRQAAEAMLEKYCK